jgi:hypothetical protein
MQQYEQGLSNVHKARLNLGPCSPETVGIIYKVVAYQHEFGGLSSVARWYIFKPKISIWVNFGGPQNGKCWNRYFIAVWNI